MAGGARVTVTSTTFHEVAQALVDAVKARLINTAAGIPVRACVVPGAIAWDACECGQLAVALDRMYLSDRFPAEDFASSPCDAPYLVGDLVVQVIRCAPNPEGMDTTVSCDRLESSAQTVSIDAYEALTAVICTLRDMRTAGEIDDYLVRPLSMQGPEGGCAGSELRALVAVTR
jgi:hypothetical protein